MRFEDLEVWKRAARLSADIYKEMQQVRDFGFRDQLTRAGLSVPSNIAEGFERESNREFVNFLSYAKGSCGELRTQIEVLPNNFSVYFQYLSAASIKTALFINRLGLIFLNQPPFP